MCEFCAKHGDGKKWYLQAKNYSDDLAADVHRRKETQWWFNYFEDGLGRDLERMEKVLPKLPRPVRHLIASFLTLRHKKGHFGQVVPIEDIESIFQIVNSIVRVPCVCRRLTVGREVHCCLGVSASPDAGMIGEVVDPSYWRGPDTDGMDELTPAEALSFMRELEKDGLMHSVWTFGTPFIGGICNCDRSDCAAMRATVGHGVKMMFKGEYVAVLDRDSCTGCRACMRLCQFGAMGFSWADRKAYIDTLKCYGCGVCRAGCSSGAISLRERSGIPLVARSW